MLFIVSFFCFLCLGASLYITAALGVSSYDAMSLIMADRKVFGLKYRYCRIATDVLCVLFGFFGHADIGAATVLTAFCMGPFISFMNEKISEPLLHR